MTHVPTALPAPSGTASVCAPERRRLRVEVEGAVQGVGFRPFVYRLATETGVAGWVLNGVEGVRVEVEGDAETVERFLVRLRSELPPRAVVHALRAEVLEPVGFEGFVIRQSDGAGRRTAVVLPDVATCDDCRREILDPADRRHGYPFTNCTNCGPRYSIIRALPYDRPHTTMAGFAMCDACRREYESPLDRRFHAQPNACPACGPRLAMWKAAGDVLVAGDSDAVLAAAAAALARGEIVGLKGIGGFQLLVDARDEAAVRRLRARKHRHGKPLALMAADVAQARTLCEVSAAEEAALLAPEAPIVLLARRPGAPVADGVAPRMRQLGVMLACSPLHHLLLRAVGAPVVATSGNLSEEPICIDERDAVRRLGAIADCFVVHDRPVERQVDDSVAWVVRDELRVLRRARGWAPLPVRVATELPPLLAVGAHQKNTIAVGVGRQAVVSQHVGDLEEPETLAAFARVSGDLLRLFDVSPVAVAHDLHPGYASSVWAAAADGPLAGLPRIGVQHHHAHLAACLAEHGVRGPALGLTWDGSGWGADADGAPDGTVWGGECLVGDARTFRRVAHLVPFRLPGGEAAVREPRRVALSLLWALLGEEAIEAAALPPVAAFTSAERRTLSSMLRTGMASPVTTSAGRLFDGVAALLGIWQRSTFEGEAAMALEQLADPAERGAYSLPLVRQPGTPALLDWRPLVAELLRDVASRVPTATSAARFHNAMVNAAVLAARHAGVETVALTGGCFQNRLLVTRAADALERAGFRVLLHRHVPPNDGGISLGQLAVAAARVGA